MRVQCTSFPGKGFKLGDIYNVFEVDNSHYRIMNKDYDLEWCHKRHFKIIENGETKGEKEMDNKKREFNFVLPSIVAYKRSEWEKDLTRENPLIVTRIDGVTDFMIHDYIMDKARFLKIGLPFITNTILDIAHLTEWVKYVKACEWEDKKVSVKVVIPKI